MDSLLDSTPTAALDARKTAWTLREGYVPPPTTRPASLSAPSAAALPEFIGGISYADLASQFRSDWGDSLDSFL